MDRDLILANLNAHAVLQNLEDLVALDPQSNQAARDWDMSIQFLVRKGPKAYISFRDGRCRVGKGTFPRPDIVLSFTSPAHFNRMFEGKANPIPLKGFTKLGFLSGEFEALTERMEHFLRPTDELLEDEEYRRLNTIFTMNTAAFAVPELAALEPDCNHVAAGLSDGIVLMKILPDGPAVNLDVDGGGLDAQKDDVARPAAAMYIQGFDAANRFFNQKTDPFTAIVSGEVSIRGRIPMLDAVSLILDRVPAYLS
ncbi:MAG: SCP2 sterol-binding domain-containing protein [Deltaproteobacteria bacterium]|nr:SCP2 sterol-binding domain-containing protein [Deltaproteobacteria bacterium]